MAIITADVLIKGKKREEIFEWLGDFTNHARILTEAFPVVESKGETQLSLGYGPIFRQRRIGYIFEGKDNDHGGRRINVRTEGKRTSGHLNYSLRTMKPASNTMVTLHWDYNTGGLIGEAINSQWMRQELQERIEKTLENLQTQLTTNPG